MTRPLHRLLTLGLTALAMACADAPATGPTAAAVRAPAVVREIVNPAVTADVMLRSEPLAADLVASAVIDQHGGSIRIPGAGFRLDVPSGAVSGPTAFTVTALAGDMVAYEFQPHGLRFARPLRFRQDLRNTNLRGARHWSLEGGYFRDQSALNHRHNKALVSEFLPVFIDVRGFRVEFDIHHFSGYMISTGRSERGPSNDNIWSGNANDN